MCEKTVAIIGSGIAGILSAKHALENGLIPYVFEKSKSIGGLWSLDSSYIWEGMIANASIYRQMFSDHSWPINSNVFPTALEMNSYLLSYVKRFSLHQHIHLNKQVISVEKFQSKYWKIKSFDLEKSTTSTDIFDFVIVATGEHAVPRIPNIQNSDLFEGIQMHSSKFKLNDTKLKSKLVVVVGNAFSGSEISDNLVNHAKQVINIFRRPYLLCSKLMKYQKPELDDTIKRNVEYNYLPWDLYFFRRAFQLPMSENRKAQIENYSNLFPEQTNKSFSHPSLFFDLNDETQPIQISLSNNYNEYVKAKMIIPIRSTIKSLRKNGLVLSDDTFLECDAIIYCTGYTKSLDEFLHIIQIKFDNLSQKNLISNSVYKCTFHPDITNLAFIGIASGLLFAGIELQAKWAAMVFSDKIQLPSRTYMINYIKRLEEKTNPLHLTLFYPNGGHLALCDSIAAEMGLLPDFNELKKTDPDSFDLLWSYAMCAPQYLFKKDKDFTLKIMNQIKNFDEFKSKQ